MADFQYSAELELNTRSFNQGLDDAARALQKLGASSTVPSQALDQLRKRFTNIQNAASIYTGAMKRLGADSDYAKRQMKSLATVVEGLNRDINKYASGGSISGLKQTNLQKDQAKILRETTAAVQAVNKAFDKKKVQEQAEAWATYESNVKASADALRSLKKDQDAAFASYAPNVRAGRDDITRAAQAQKDGFTLQQRQEMGFAEARLHAQRVANAREQERMTAQAIRSQEQYIDSLGNTRYALYDVANTMTVVAAATLGMVTAGTALSASYERAFASVERTSGAAGQQLQELHDDLVNLTTGMPTSFDELTDIATLGGQLGIAAKDIAAFTQTVSMFSATTDVTATAAAEQLGRLLQLSDIEDHGEIQNLAAAIYEVGVNSVATESAILAVSNQIAVSGNLAGFTADQTVALAGALASLGIMPEAARGSIMRIFNNIRMAVDSGGDSLERFAHLSNMTGEEFQRMWRSDPQEAFVRLLDGMHAASEGGENLMQILSNMGIRAVRDQRAILTLADNMNVYKTAIDDSASAFREGTALQEGYAVVAQTLSARIEILLGTLKSVVAEGFTPMLDAIGPLVDLLQWFAERLLVIAQHPVGGAIMSIVAGLTALVGVTALAVGGWARLNGAMIAMLQATNQYLKQKAGLIASEYTVNGLLGEQLGLILGVTRAKVGNAAATQSLTVANSQYAASLAASSAGGNKAVAAARAFTGALGPLVLALAAVTAMGVGYYNMLNSARSADSLFGVGSTGLAQAIKEDTAAYEEGAEAFRKYYYTVNEAGERTSAMAKTMGVLGDAADDPRLAEWQRTLEDSLGTQSGLRDEINQTTGAIQEQFLVIGDATKAYIAQTLAMDEEFQQAWRNVGDTIARTGITLEELLEKSLSSPNGATSFLEEELKTIEDRMHELQYIWKSNPMVDGDRSLVNPAMNAEIDALIEKWAALNTLKENFSAVDMGIGDELSSMNMYNELLSAMGVEADLLGDEFEETSGQIAGFADGLFDAVNGVANFNEAIFDLHESLAENGDDFSAYSGAGIENIQALERAVRAAADQAGSDIGQFGANLANIFAQMEGAGVTAGAELDFLRQQLVATFNQTYGLDLDISNARGSIHQFIADAITALRVRAEIERRAQFSDRKGSNITTRKGSDIGAYQEIQGQIAALQGLQGQLKRAERAGRDAGQGIADGMKKAGNAAKKAGDNAKDAAKEIYTLVDYASDLSSLFTRANDLRFGNQEARDDVTSIYDAMREKAQEAAEKIRDLRQKMKELRAEIGTLKADRNTLQFQLGVALEYGDTLRATEIRAELAENSAEIADKNNELKDTEKDLRKEQDANTKSLKGNTKGAKDNRKTVLDLIKGYRGQLTTMAANGASQDQLRRKSGELKEEFKRQLIQMGYNREEVDKYALAFDDFTEIIEKVPRNITVTAKGNTSPATQALNEWIEKNKNRSITVKTKTTTPKVGGTVSGGSWKPSSVSVGTGGVSTKGISVGGTISGSTIRATKSMSTPTLTADRVNTKGMTRGMATGGRVEYHARGGVGGMHPGFPRGTDTVPAWLTPGEFVQQKRAVDYYGLPFMNAVNSLKFPKFFSTGGFVSAPANSGGRGGNAIQLVELLPHQLQQIVRAVQQSAGSIRIGNDTIARAANAANARSAARGSH